MIGPSRTGRVRRALPAIGAAIVPTLAAVAQDSVGTAGGVAGGDALSAYTVGAGSTQIRNYVVDLTPRPSSWGRSFLFGPIAKASASTTAGQFTNIVGAAALSNRFTGLQPLLRTTYSAWASAGQGVNSARNGTPTDNGSGQYGLLNVSGRRAASFAGVFVEYGGGNNTAFGDNDDESNVVAFVAGFEPFAPRRLYVSRIMAATNRLGASSGQFATAIFGVGGVDEGGGAHVLADGFGLSGVSGMLTQKQLWRIDAALRSATVNNVVNATGAADTTANMARRLQSSDVSVLVPTGASRAAAGRPVLLGLDFANRFIHEPTSGTLATVTSHVDPGVSLRGAMSYVRGAFSPLAPGGAGLCAALARGPSSTRTRSIALWAIDGAGTPLARLHTTIPEAGAVDPVDGFDPAAAFGSPANQEFTSYASQAPFRGGSGPVAFTVLPEGHLLAAAVVASTGYGDSVPQSQDNHIAVVRIDAGGLATWTIAAHTGRTANGFPAKDLRGDNGEDGIPGTGDAGEGDGVLDDTPIGNLVRHEELPGAARTGPSISAPAMDCRGNLYFTAAVSLRGQAGPRLTRALIRANLVDRDGYLLEVLLAEGDVLAGANSLRNYQVQSLALADSDSADSGAPWSGTITQATNPVINPASPLLQGANSLGALAVRARIVYDHNGDGQYQDPSMPGLAASTDQGYFVSMIVMPPGRLVADVTQDGFITGEDFDLFIQAFFSEAVDPGTGLLIADLVSGTGTPSPDGFLTGADFDRFIEAFFAGE